VSTGPEATEHTQEREKIYQLIPVRDALKARKAAGENFTAADEASLASIRAQLKELISVWKKTGYAYTGQIYREISMQNSDYGGMENVGQCLRLRETGVSVQCQLSDVCLSSLSIPGNTTIVASRMVPSDLLPDVGYVYSQAPGCAA
jgi:hypothetical protein